MSKIVKTIWMLVLVLGMFALGALLADKYTLSTRLIRLRVVAASDGESDQRLKLQVRDAVNSYLQENMPENLDVKAAKEYLQSQTGNLRIIAQEKLRQSDYDGDVQVYLCREEAQARVYDTFSLPSGVYDTLRVDIGAGAGQNWWCVVFPALCIPDTAEAFEQTAVACGMNENLADTLSATQTYEVRFFLLDCLGKLENLLHRS